MEENEDLFDDSVSEGINHSSSQRSLSTTVFNILCGLKNLFCSGMFVKGSAFVVGFWHPSKGLRAIMAVILLLVDIFFVIASLFKALICQQFQTPLNTWLCGNTSSTNSSSTSLASTSLVDILSFVASCANLMSYATFFWCVWKLQQRTVYCVTLEKAFSTAGRSIWVTLNVSMLIFGFLVVEVFWFYFNFKESFYGSFLHLMSIFPAWAILTSSWMFVVITSAMKDCVMQCQAEIRQSSIDCSLDDVIRIHKRLWKQMLSTSESLKVWFVTHWFMFAVVVVIYVASMLSFFEQVIDWYLLYHHVLVSLLMIYVFVYPSYCAASVTTQCNRMLRELNMTTDEDWPTGHPFCNRFQLALFLQYAQYTNCGFQVGEIVFGANFAWFSTLIAMCGLGVKVL
ncbi:unnamed protein product [Porites evermanni]|uniref:Gustatory receptor n=1 Tax=Porites evermanni TaxID=104178 RepID=A0ABN8MLN4_9CNID|nr:unnamed protein product [Porites evermanni]